MLFEGGPKGHPETDTQSVHTSTKTTKRHAKNHFPKGMREQKRFSQG